ncbi:K02A2.6-like, partial [Cordylochernes scorpioides]
MVNEEEKPHVQPAAFTYLQQPRNLPNFSGKGSELAHLWLKDYSRVAAYNGWDESMCLANVVFFLEGAARCWFDNVEESITTWNTFKEEFTRTFGDKEDYARRIESSLKVRAQKPDESVELYIQDVLNLCRQLNPNMSEEDRVGHLMKGVAENIYRALLAIELTTTGEFTQHCRRIEKLNKNRISSVRFERIPTVSAINENEYHPLKEMIREIIREELRSAPNELDNLPPPQGLEDRVWQRDEQNLAPIDKAPVFHSRMAVKNFRSGQQNAGEAVRRKTDEFRTRENIPICFYCNRPGHVAKHCWDRRRDRDENEPSRTQNRFYYGRRRPGSIYMADFMTPHMEQSDRNNSPRRNLPRSSSPYPGRGRPMTRRRYSRSPDRTPSRSPHRDGANIYSTIDLKAGYWQIGIDEADREKTAFITPDGLFEFKVMPFGLCNAPATFERMMDNLLKGLRWTICLCYLDDVVIFADNFPDHLRRLEVVLNCFKRAGLKLNPGKCSFGASNIKILGHQVNKDGIRPDDDKIKAVSQFPIPKNLQQLRSFLGLSSYYRRFIKNYADIARPLNSLLSKGTKFQWNTDQERAFQKLKNALTSKPVLGHFDDDAPTELHTDASGYGIGAVLAQKQGNVEKVIAYASRTLLKSEKNYSTTERECLAIVWAIGKFRPYLFGRPIKVIIDHHSLCWLTNLKDPAGRLARWALRLQEYDVSIVYKTGRMHKDADCLSRNPIETTEKVFNNNIPTLFLLSDISKEQEKDPYITGIIKEISQPSPAKKDKFEVVNGILYRKNYDPTGLPLLLVIPRHLRMEILGDLHDAPTAGHLGFAKTYDRIRRRFFWPGMYRSVRKYVGHCQDCQRRKSVPQLPPGYLRPIRPPDRPFQKVGIDLLGRFPISQGKKKWIVVCTDYLTKYAVTQSLGSGGAQEIAKFILEEVILKHGAPREIVMDRGRNFQSRLIQELTKNCHIKKKTTTAYHPQTNGLTERLNRTIADMLSMYMDLDQKNWDEMLPFITFAYNTARQESTGFTPFYLVHGREAETTLDTIFPYSSASEGEEFIQLVASRAEEARQIARHHIFKAQETNKLNYDARHKGKVYQPGDLVWIFTPIRRVGLSEKLLKRYFGPYKFIKNISDVTYEVEAFGKSDKRQKGRDTVHILRMKPYYDPSRQEDSSTLKKIAEKCEFPDLEDRLRDALVCGILNGEIQSMLLMNSMLTFKVAQEMALAHEAAVKNVAEIKDGKPQEEINVMGRAVKVRRRNEKIFKCFRCGYTNPREEQCFFKEKRYFKCQKLGHISRVCKNGNWRSDRNNNCSIDEEAEATNGLFNINQVKDTSNMRNYMVKVRTSGRDMNMLIDSGTRKNIISEKTYIRTWVKSERPRIEKDYTKLVQWNRQRLSILGKIKADVKVNKRSITMEFLVIEGPGPNLIGREAFDQIGIGLEWMNYGDSVCQINEVMNGNGMAAAMNGNGKGMAAAMNGTANGMMSGANGMGAGYMNGGEDMYSEGDGLSVKTTTNLASSSAMAWLISAMVTDCRRLQRRSNWTGRSWVLYGKATRLDGRITPKLKPTSRLNGIEHWTLYGSSTTISVRRRLRAMNQRRRLQYKQRRCAKNMYPSFSSLRPIRGNRTPSCGEPSPWLDSKTNKWRWDWFRMATEEKLTSGGGSEPYHEACKVSIKIPPFWTDKPEIWFYQVEAQFNINAITSEETKFNYLIAQLEPKYIENVWDIITLDNKFKYTESKTRLLNIFKDSESVRIKKLISGIELGNMKPSQLLQKLRSLATSDISSNLIKTLWLEKLPDSMRNILLVSDEDVTKLASMADKIMDMTFSPDVCSASSSQTSHTNMENLLKKNSSLERQVSEINLSRSRPTSMNQGHRFSRSRRKYDPKGKFCFYHFRFGVHCIPEKCKPPCKWTKDMYLQIPPPEPVNFRGNIEENWRYFKSHWRNFSIATGLDNKEDKLKVATLLSIIGKEAYNIFEHLDLSDEQRNNSDEIINALTQHFTPKINIIYERSIFNQTNQETNESIEQYICRLRKLSSTCNYGAMTEEMIRDRLVLGIIDKQTKRQLISDPQLTLQKAIDVYLCKIMQDGNPSLKPSYIKLRCYGGEILKPRGQIKINCSHQSKQHPIVFQVIDHWEKPILSAETCQKLNLIEIKADLCKIESTWTKQNNLLDKYKDIFEGIGCLQGEYKLETDPTIKPIKQAPRRVPITLRKELKEKLIDMEKKNIIAKVDYPTDWISNLVLVKSTKKLRICIDPRELNVALKRAEYPIPTIEKIIPNLQNAKIFTVVDTKDGFWNVKLSDESSNLTTFWTPFGRYKFLRMPFGLKTASEEYQRRLYEIFQGLEGIEIIADDILILGKGDSYEEALKDHDRNLENLFKTARQANLKFNINKVKLRLKEVKYLGHIITPHGLKPDPEKVKALKEMPHPESITELESFLGFATYLCKYMPNISMISEPLRKLTMKNSTWSWSKNHQAAFEQIKDLASKAPILRYFDTDKSIAIQCDASKHGLGATLLQESQPIIFASRSLSKTEQNYAQIEKECLAIVFACERFHQYILGKCQVIVQTDHKPLLSIFKKSILKAPQRLQRMLLRLQRYNLELEHVQGSQMHLADIFSRACIKDVRNENLKYDVYPIDIIYKEIATVNVMETLSVCSDTVLRIREETSSDPILCEVKKLILNGWPPNKNQTSMLTREYCNFREELTVQDGIILKNDRIVIPNKLRAEMIMKTHQGYIGINSSMRRARDNIFWPGMNAQIGQEIENCSICLSNSQNQVREPMKSHKIPNYPWERISLDIFEIFKQNYLIIVDHYSDFFEVECLENTTSEYIIECCKRQFSRYGIPQIIVSDNGRQFTSTEFQKFSKEWQFQHSTSSPLHSQGNGEAEAAVKIAKNLLKKSKQENSDFWQNLLNWRNTPTIDIDSSPVQRIMSRRTRAILPIHPNLLKPSIPENIPDKISIKRQQAKYYYDRKSKNLPDLDIGQEVYVRTPNTTPSWSKANITNEHNTRSYDVNIHGRTYRRNRTWIKPQQASANQKSTNNQEEGRKESIDQEQTVSNCLPSTSSAGGDNIVKRTRIETTECRIQSKSDSPTVSEPENAASETRTRSGRLVKKPRPPVHSKARQLDPKRLAIAKQEFKFMLENDIIRPSKSHWASPLHMVAKKDGSFRLCGDYRQLNAKTVTDRYPIPRIEDFHHILKDAKIFSKIDLLKAYFQIPIEEKDKCKTAVITPFGLYEYNVMNFGLKNAPSSFQRFIHEVLWGLDFVFPYLDDILIASASEVEHSRHLKIIFERLNKYGLKINVSKSIFGVTELNFLGYLVTPEGSKPLPDKKSEKATPRQLRQLQFISQFSTDIRHIKGQDNIVADALSRIEELTLLDYDEIAERQRNDGELRNLQSTSKSLNFKQYPLSSGKYLWCDTSTNHIRPYIPESFRFRMFQQIHGLSHPGSLPPSNGNTYCLTCIDRFSNWMEVVPLENISAERVARAFYENWISRFGTPHRLISDRGAQFTSETFKCLSRLCGFKLQHTTAYHPQCNGKVERLHRTIKAALRTHDNLAWSETLPTVLGLRTALQEDTNLTIAKMVYRQNIRLPGEFFCETKILPSSETFANKLQKQMESMGPRQNKVKSSYKIFVPKDLSSCTHIFLRVDK